MCRDPALISKGRTGGMGKSRGPGGEKIDGGRGWGMKRGKGFCETVALALVESARGAGSFLPNSRALINKDEGGLLRISS